MLYTGKLVLAMNQEMIAADDERVLLHIGGGRKGSIRGLRGKGSMGGIGNRQEGVTKEGIVNGCVEAKFNEEVI